MQQSCNILMFRHIANLTAIDILHIQPPRVEITARAMYSYKMQQFCYILIIRHIVNVKAIDIDTAYTTSKSSDTARACIIHSCISSCRNYGIFLEQYTLTVCTLCALL